MTTMLHLRKSDMNQMDFDEGKEARLSRGSERVALLKARNKIRKMRIARRRARDIELDVLLSLLSSGRGSENARGIVALLKALNRGGRV